MRSLFPQALAGALVSTMLIGTATASGGSVLRAYVDPVSGGAGVIGDPNKPFLRLNDAIDSLALISSPSNPGLVIAGPGIYSGDTNRESLPVIMKDYVNLQGVGARRCVIRGDGSQTPFQPFWPTPPLGDRPFKEILVDFSFIEDDTSESMIDGFTFQGGDVQVYAEPEFYAITGRVSNCLFDLVENGPLGLYGPSFGLLMVHPYQPEFGSYLDIQLNVLNNTFIQGRDPDGFPNGNETVAISENVAICDVRDPNGDPEEPDLDGIGNPNIQNNLIRSLAFAGRTALLGIDAGDTSVAGAFPGETNAYGCPLVAATISPLCSDAGGHSNPMFASNILGAPPKPRVEIIPFLGGKDPAFVGEMLNAKFGPTDPNPALGDYIDWRLLPDSELIDKGLGPNGGGRITATNGTFYEEDPMFPELHSYDWDHEGYGNPRIGGAAVDIGFDEAGPLIVAGSYGNSSNSHNNPWDPMIAQGQPRRYMILPEDGFALWVVTWSAFQPGLGWSNPPGTLNPPQVIPDDPPNVIITPPYNFGYLGVPLGFGLLQLPFNAPKVPFTNPQDGTSHEFGLLKFGLQDTPTTLLMNQQLILVTPSNEVLLSNLQTEYF